MLNTNVGPGVAGSKTGGAKGGGGEVRGVEETREGGRGEGDDMEIRL